MAIIGLTAVNAVLTSGMGDMKERAPPIARYKRILTR
jgi:hypothetical protein